MNTPLDRFIAQLREEEWRLRHEASQAFILKEEAAIAGHDGIVAAQRMRWHQCTRMAQRLNEIIVSSGLEVRR